MTPTIEALRLQHRPDRVVTLFVGESPPAAGTFFYLENSNLYRHMREAFVQLSMVDSAASFLSWFRDQGWYLDDLVSMPLNRCSGPQRRRAHRGAVAGLAARLAEYQPLAVVVTPLKIKESVSRALASSRIRAQLYPVAFPAFSNESRFLREIKAIGRDLPRNS